MWGGENGLGIDCSGLVRRALVLALWQEGLWSFNPRLAREAIVLWWHDASARELAGDYRGQTRFLFASSSIMDLDSARLMPGDLAVTSDGVHVLAYLEGGQWIEADPGLGRVVTLHADNKAHDVNTWLKEPVNIVRWRRLTD